MNILIVIALHSMAAMGLALLVGYAGQISLGHAAFYGLGAYGSALISTRIGVDPWLSSMTAATIVGLLGYAIGWVIFRVRGHHLAIATLAFGIVVSIAFVELRGLTGGANGLPGIAPFALGKWALNTDAKFACVAFLGCTLAYYAASRLVRSPAGLLLQAIAESERAAAAYGADVAALKRSVLGLSAAMAALAGALYAHYIGFISPQPFGTGFSIRLLLMVAIGGFQNLQGVLVGAAFITMITEPLQNLGYYDVVVFGLLLIGIVVFCPKGMLSELGKFVRWPPFRRRPRHMV
ncbi:MAG TPA: branched-chain amino acid ABC transporter permease [Burkholderiales bacterium]|nr:branched-chain amino acid ABC transporter permease [Burkholderiales bacterium]